MNLQCACGAVFDTPDQLAEHVADCDLVQAF